LRQRRRKKVSTTDSENPSNFDHHNGKLVKELEQQGQHASIVFEDGHRITLGNVSDLPEGIVGLALLTVEPIPPSGHNLVFGYTLNDAPAVRVHEIAYTHGKEAEQPQPGDDDHFMQFEGTLADGLDEVPEGSSDPVLTPNEISEEKPNLPKPGTKLDSPAEVSGEKSEAQAEEKDSSPQPGKTRPVGGRQKRSKANDAEE
jgi:hypothetical protein